MHYGASDCVLPTGTVVKAMSGEQIREAVACFARGPALVKRGRHALDAGRDVRGNIQPVLHLQLLENDFNLQRVFLSLALHGFEHVGDDGWSFRVKLAVPVPCRDNGAGNRLRVTRNAIAAVLEKPLLCICERRGGRRRHRAALALALERRKPGGLACGEVRLSRLDGRNAQPLQLVRVNAAIRERSGGRQ